MKEKICKYLKDEFCTNGDCPMRGDYCPVAQDPGVCRYEELVPAKPYLSPKECLRKAFAKMKYTIDDMSDFDTDQIILCFLGMMKENGHIAHIKSDYDINDESDFQAGMILSKDYIANSPHWNSINCGPNKSVYVTNDRKHQIEFYTNSTVSQVIKRDSGGGSFVAGQHIHVGVIGASNEWRYVGEVNDETVYATTDGALMVSFGNDSVWGTIRLNKSSIVPYQCGGIKEGDKVPMSDIASNVEWKKSSPDNSDYVVYTSKDDNLIVAFKDECDVGIVIRKRNS